MHGAGVQYETEAWRAATERSAGHPARARGWQYRARRGGAEKCRRGEQPVLGRGPRPAGPLSGGNSKRGGGQLGSRSNDPQLAKRGGLHRASLVFVPLGSLYRGHWNTLFLIGGVSPRGPRGDKH